MRRVFLTRHFSRWMRKTELTESALCLAVAEMAAGLIEADLSGGVIKKRVAIPGRGKSAPCWRRTGHAVGSSSSGSRRTNAQTSPERKSKRCSDWLETFFGSAPANSKSM